MAVGDSSNLEFSHRMEDSGKTIKVSVLWKGNNYSVEIDSGASLKDLGYELRKLTGVTAETLRLIVPKLNEKGSILILPFSEQHSSLSLQESNIIEVSLCFWLTHDPSKCCCLFSWSCLISLICY